MIDSLDDFILLEKIGHGKVYKVQEKKTGNFYAAKCINISLDDSSHATLADISREINILIKTKHKAIIEFKCFSKRDFQNNKCPVIIMEYMENGSLSTLFNKIRNNIPIPAWNSTGKLINIYGIASAISYLHSHNIMHRNLKPDNILMDNFLHPKVSNFCLSKIIQSEELAATKDTASYIAPEILKDCEYTPKCDVYSYGIIVYEIMTNLIPFKDQNGLQIIQFVLKGNRPPLTSDIPTSYKSLIERCWAQEPRERPAFDEILSLLKNNKEFITAEVDEKEYLNYVDYIDNQQKCFEPNSNVNDINQTVPIEKPVDKLESIFKGSSEKVQQTNESEFNKTDQYHAKQKQTSEALSNAPKESKAKFNYYKQLADKKVPEAMYECGLMLLQGEGVEKNEEEALHYFKMAAEKGHQESMIKCGFILKERDKKESILYFEKAAKEGNPEGMAEYGRILFYGDGIPIDKSEALKFIKRGAENKNPKALNTYGLILQNGDGIKADEQEAEKYFRMAIDAGNKDAAYNYAIMLLHTQLDLYGKQKIGDYFKMAIEYGNSDAMYKYAQMLWNGERVPTDKKESVRYFKMASDNGNSYAMCNYATILLHGEGIPKNKDEAVKYYKMSIEKGNSDAMYKYATMLLDEDCNQKNKDEAISYLKMAIKRGNIEAILKYAEIYNDFQRAEKQLKSMILKGNAEASYYLAELMFEGKVSGKSSQILHYYNYAADNGIPKAIKKYAYILYYSSLDNIPNINRANEYLKKRF